MTEYAIRLVRTLRPFLYTLVGRRRLRPRRLPISPRVARRDGRRYHIVRPSGLFQHSIVGVAVDAEPRAASPSPFSPPPGTFSLAFGNNDGGSRPTQSGQGSGESLGGRAGRRSRSLAAHTVGTFTFDAVPSNGARTGQPRGGQHQRARQQAPPLHARAGAASVYLMHSPRAPAILSHGFDAHH